MAICRRVALFTAVGAVLMTAASLTVTAKAEASWPCYRDASEEHHCYDLSAWHMRGCTLECVDGGVADIETRSVNVPGWESGDFVTNELWVSNHTTPGWVESGQLAGSYGCCSVHPFFAAKTTDGKHYYFYEQPGEIGLNQYNDYVIQDLDHSGIWRIYWGKENTNWVEVHAYGGYWAQVDELEAGMEGGANTQPYNEGSQALATVYGSPESWHSWEGVYAKTHYLVKPSGNPSCITPWQNSWPGNAVYHTPC